MVINSVHVKNFRAILDETLQCDALTAIVGSNGAGKSTFLRALEWFYNPPARVEIGDFHNGDTTGEISITVTFTNLTPEATELFSPYIRDAVLAVECVTRMVDGKHTTAYHGAAPRHKPFSTIWELLNSSGRARDAKTSYNDFLANTQYSDLPTWSSAQAAKDALAAWEKAHPDKCSLDRDNGQFFGFKAVAQGYLGRFTRFLFIPAVRDVSAESSDTKGSVLTSLMDMVVRSQLARNSDLIALQEETQKRYAQIVDPSKMKELSGLESELSNTLQTFVPEASVKLEWQPTEPIELSLPRANVQLSEDNYSSTVQRTGHGLQRAFLITLLQHLTKAQAAPEEVVLENVETVESQGPAKEVFRLGDDEQPTKPGSTVLNVPRSAATKRPNFDSGPAALPNLVLAIEEPELYQHPNRQRHFARILLDLSSGTTPGVAKATQVLYATHSPLFVDIERFDQVRLLRKAPTGNGKPKQTKAICTTLDEVARLVWIADGEKGTQYTGSTLASRLQSILTPRINEGFFAQTVVLVEGEDEYAAIQGTARAYDLNLDALGISVIPVGGRRSMDRPAIIFKELGIPTYLVWDADGKTDTAVENCKECGKALKGRHNPDENRRLLRVVGAPEEDWPSAITETYCCFAVDLETTLKQEIGHELFTTLMEDCKIEFGISKSDHAIKNPFVITKIIKGARTKGAESDSLRQVLFKIEALARISGLGSVVE